MIKYLLSDLDGTLLAPNGQVSPETIKTITTGDWPLTLVSARAPLEMQETIQALQLKGPQIGFNGGLIYEYRDETVQPLHSRPLSNERANQLLTQISSRFPKMSLSYYTLDGWYTYKLDNGVRAEERLTGQKAQLIHLKQSEPVFKVMLMTLDWSLMQQVQQWLADLHLTDVSSQLSGTTYLEITSVAAKKSQAIDFIKKHAGLQTAELAAFGDGENDLPMLRAVGCPIVMENALPQVKKVAEFVTKSNVDNGVAYAIRNYLPKRVHA